MTEAARRQARDRRVASDPRKTPLAPLKQTEPHDYVEARTLEYVKKMEDLAAQAEAAGNLTLAAQIYRDLVRLTSLGRTRLDVTAQLERAEVPDLSMLSPEQLLRIIEEAKDLKGPITIEIPEKTESNGHRGDAEENSPA